MSLIGGGASARPFSCGKGAETADEVRVIVEADFLRDVGNSLVGGRQQGLCRIEADLNDVFGRGHLREFPEEPAELGLGVVGQCGQPLDGDV